MLILNLIKKYKFNKTLKKLESTGENFDCDLSVSIDFPERINIGNYVYVGHKTYLNGRGNLTIHDYAIISAEVIILTSMHNFDNASMIPYDNVELLRPVTIERCCWIGIRSIIMPGVTIGEGSIVAAGSIVTKSCLPGSIIGGNPAKLIRMRNMIHYKNCIKNNNYYLLRKKNDHLTKKELLDTKKNNPT